MEFTSEEALKKYLQEHPKADVKQHSVKSEDSKGSKDKPKSKSKSREIKPADGGEPHHVMSAAGDNKVFMGNYTVKHLQTHAKTGKGSVFSGKIDPKDVSAAISKIPAEFFDKGGGAFEIDVPNAGSDLVQKSSDILKKYPNAKKITVPKQEGVEMGDDGKPKMGPDGKPIPKMINVTAYVVDDGDEAFKTNKMTVILRPANPAFMPAEAKEDEELSGALGNKKGFAMLTAFPGKPDVPKASEWGDEYAIIVPNGGKGADDDVQKALSGKKASKPSPIRVASRYLKASLTLAFVGNVGAKSSKIQGIGKKAADELKELVGPEQAEVLIQNKLNRDKGFFFHVTIFSPPEVKDIVNKMAAEKGLSKSKASDEFRAEVEAFGLSDSGLKSLGLGKAEKGSDVAYFAVLEWPDAQDLRAKFGISPFDFHTTIGFDKADVHGVRKDRSTLV